MYVYILYCHKFYIKIDSSRFRDRLDSRIFGCTLACGQLAKADILGGQNEHFVEASFFCGNSEEISRQRTDANPRRIWSLAGEFAVAALAGASPTAQQDIRSAEPGA